MVEINMLKQIKLLAILLFSNLVVSVQAAAAPDISDFRSEAPASKGSNFEGFIFSRSGKSWECGCEHVGSFLEHAHHWGYDRSDFRESMDRLAERFAKDRANPYNAEVISHWKQAYLAYAFDRLKRNAPLDPTIGHEIKPSSTSEAVTTDDKGGVTIMKVAAPAGYYFKAWNTAELEPYWRKSLTTYDDQAEAIESDWRDVCKLVDDPRTSAATIAQMQSLMRANPEIRE